MSGQFPTSVIISGVEIRSVQSVFNSRSLSGKRQSRLGSGHIWEMEIEIEDMLRDEFAPLWGFVLKQKGSYDTFTIIIPGHQTPRGSWSGAPVYSSTTNDNTIVAGGFTPDDTDVVKAGDFFTFAGITKVYCVTEDADADVSGNANVKFEPPLISTPGGSAAITSSNVAMTVELDENALRFRRTGIIYSGIKLRMTEALV